MRERKQKKGWDRSTWVSLSPNGLGFTKPNHYWDMLKVARENRDQLPYAWRILTQGVCDGCALGTSGLKDWTMDGPHLCSVRLNLLRLNTMPALDTASLSDAAGLRAKTSGELRGLGRLPYPMIRRKGEPGFHRISWGEALNLASDRIREASSPAGPGLSFYLTSRGLTNETYYVAQKVARFLGTNNVDQSARICHAPSTIALKQAIGASASTCSYRDWIGTDLLVFIGSDVPNNQPVTTKYMYHAKKAGTRILVVNAFREPGMEQYWIPSAVESALFGTRLADEFYLVHVGGDVAFFNGVVKSLIETDSVDTDFIAAHTEGFDELAQTLRLQKWDSLEQKSGASRSDMERFARNVAEAKSAIFVWSMGITQHKNGVDNVRSIINVALARGYVGREKCGLMPIRGHSGVQGAAEMGCYATALPGGLPINEENITNLESLWGFRPPSLPGLDAVKMIDAAANGDLDVFYSIGGNFLETLPQPDYVRGALESIPLRIHHDIVLTSQMLVEPNDTVLLLPATTRYEQPGGGTETTTERRVIYNPEIPGRRIGEARCEWETLIDLAQRVWPERSQLIAFSDAAAIRREIASVVPAYAGINGLRKRGDQFQWGGPRLCEGYSFDTPDGKAHFAALQSPDAPEPGRFRLTTRRGKQFNSMVQADRDPLTGASRDSVLMSSDDARKLNLPDGGAVVLKNEFGEFNGRVRIAPMRPGNLQVHWPEGNILIPRGIQDESGVPDYNALVDVIREEDAINQLSAG